MPFADPKKAKDYNRAYQRRWMKAKADRWRAHGCCCRCGLPTDKFTRCLECRTKLHERYWRKTRDRLFTRCCPKHPETRISRTANSCQVCARQKMLAARRATNKTIGPLIQLLTREALSVRQLSDRIGVAKPSIVKALRRVMLQRIGLERQRNGRSTVYRIREAA